LLGENRFQMDYDPLSKVFKEFTTT
jgi:hypothetical protein